MEFDKPYERLKELTRDTKKGKYHKVKHGVELLKKLDSSKLEIHFPDFADLIGKLGKT